MDARVALRSLVLLVTLSGAPAAVASPEGEARSFVGTYVHAGGEADQQARLDAIEAAVAQLPALFQGVARERLLAGSGVPGHYEIDLDGDEIAIGIDTGEAWRSPLDGTPVRMRHQGQSFTLRRTLVDGAIHSHAEQRTGSGRFVFRLSDDGQVLSVTTTMDSPVLPAPVEFVSTYRKR